MITNKQYREDMRIIIELIGSMELNSGSKEAYDYLIDLMNRMRDRINAIPDDKVPKHGFDPNERVSKHVSYPLEESEEWKHPDDLDEHLAEGKEFDL